MRRVALLIAATAFLAAVATAIAGAAFPKRIDLPNGYAPEGIATGKGKQLYVGSIPTGEVRRVDARSGDVDPLVAPREGRAAIGLKVDRRNRLFVAGGPTGKAFVYDARDGDDLAQLRLAPAGAQTFVNDVAVTKQRAYFTDSRRSVLYVARTDLKGTPQELPLPDVPLLEGFNLNGITATPNGKTLIAVQSNAGVLWRIDPGSGRAQRIDLGDADVKSGDGLLLVGKRRLYVAQNQLNRIAVIRLSGDLRRGRVEEHLTSDGFDFPTTLARVGDRLYAPNARFGTPVEPGTRYWITQVRR